MISKASHAQAKAKAIIEVVAVFIITVLGFKAINMSPLGEWENQVIGRYFFEYVVVLFVPMAILIVTRRSFSDYGIDFKNLGYHLRVVVVGIIPESAEIRQELPDQLGGRSTLGINMNYFTGRAQENRA